MFHEEVILSDDWIEKYILTHFPETLKAELYSNN